MHLVSLIIIVAGWLIVALGVLGQGVTFHLGNLDALMTGVVFVLAGLTLRGGKRSLWPF